MLCDNCKNKKATVVYEENINGEKKKVNLCVECSNKFGIFNMNFIDSMFMSLLDEPVINKKENTKIGDTKCMKCGYTFSDYVNTGLLGCDECYSVFENKLKPILHKLHGTSNHIIQKEDVSKKSSNSEIELLQNKLKKYVENEEYEKAAIVRDEIKKIKERGEA